jgi:hypothetical protein
MQIGKRTSLVHVLPNVSVCVINVCGDTSHADNIFLEINFYAIYQTVIVFKVLPSRRFCHTFCMQSAVVFV